MQPNARQQVVHQSEVLSKQPSPDHAGDDRGDQPRKEEDNLGDRGPLRGLRHDEGTDHKTDRKSTRLNSSHVAISYAVFCLRKKIYNTNRIAKTYLFIFHDWYIFQVKYSRCIHHSGIDTFI